MVFNVPTLISLDREGTKVHMMPTVVSYPTWYRGLKRVKEVIIGEENITMIDSEFTLRGLMSSPVVPDAPVAIDPNDVLPFVEKMAPVDGKEMTQWMHEAMAQNIVMSARIMEYNSGSPGYLTGNSTDPRYPGLVVGDIRFQSEPGLKIREKGYGTVITPLGNYHVPFRGKRPGIFKDLLSWGSCTSAGVIQWVASLLKWLRLKETPIRQRIGFYMDLRGNNAPNFFVQKPKFPRAALRVKQVFSSNDRQEIHIRFRDPSDYTRVVGEKVLDISRGTHAIEYSVSAFPFVPPLVSEIQPEDGVQTVLVEYDVS